MGAAMNFSSAEYGPAVASLLAIDAPYGPTPQRPVAAARETLKSLDHAALFGMSRVVDRNMADCCLAGLWLWFDFLDESHTISQNIETPTGSFWHGILHRREPDYGNAKYWFARVRNHPVYAELAKSLPRIASANSTAVQQGDWLQGNTWDATKFVDLCERGSRSGGALEELCRQLQIAEWQALFDYCFRQAQGGNT
jgi:hypothetical protein